MSSGYVRTLVETWLNELTVPYYPTVNEDQNPQDDIWCTAEFSSAFRESTTFCGGYTTEEGDVEVVYWGRPGIGEDTLIAALEADMVILMAKRDLTQKLVLLNRTAPFEYTSGSAEEGYGLSVEIDYQLYE